MDFDPEKLPWLAGMALGVFFLLPTLAAAGDVNAGRKLAETHCQRCHVVPGRGNMGIGSTPSFAVMVRSKRADWRQRFEVFYSLRPHPNFVRIEGIEPLNDLPAVVTPFTLSAADLEDLMAYVDVIAASERK